MLFRFGLSVGDLSGLRGFMFVFWGHLMVSGRFVRVSFEHHRLDSLDSYYVVEKGI